MQTWEKVDIRKALIQNPVAESPVMLTCPPQIHEARLGYEDVTRSLAVYRSNAHCFGCGFHLARRYATLAFVLGEWDGQGDEYDAVKRVMPRLQDFLNNPKPIKRVGAEVDPYAPESFHQYLLRYMRAGVDYLIHERGLTMDTIKRFKLGHTGTHFSLPIFDQHEELLTIRFRADDRWVDEDTHKYVSAWGSSLSLYPLPMLCGLRHINELWVTEGEFDALSNIQAGNVTITTTNGAGSLRHLYRMFRAMCPTLTVGTWVLATDQDVPGKKAEEDVLKELSQSGERWFRARWPFGKDLCEFFAGGGRKEEIQYAN